MGKAISWLGLIVAVAGAVEPFVTASNPRYGAAIAALGALAAALGDSLAPKRGPRKFAVAVLAVGLALPVVGCDDNQLRKAAVASDRCANLIAAAIAAKRELRSANLIDASEDRELSEALLKLNLAVREFNERAAAYPKLTPNARDELAGYFADIVRSVERLNSAGVLGLKSPKARERISALMRSLEESVRVIGTLFGNGKGGGDGGQAGFSGLRQFHDFEPTRWGERVRGPQAPVESIGKKAGA